MKNLKPIYLILVTFNKISALLSGRDGNVLGYSTPDAAKSVFENSYKEAHNRSYESSMSANIHFILFNPQLIKLDAGEEGFRKFVKEVCIMNGEYTQLANFSCIAGSLRGVLVNESINKYLLKENQISLIKNEWLK